MKRKIVHIAAIQAHPTTDIPMEVIALADDGTLWRGSEQCLNVDEVKAYYAAVKSNALATTSTSAAPKGIYGWKWDELPGLPDDSRNLTKQNGG